MRTDPVRIELIKNSLGSVVDEMVLTVVRVAYSSIMKDTMDLSSAFFDRRGRMIAQGLSIPLHLGSFPDSMEAVLTRYPEGLAEGDVVILNDPYHGGMHLPDIFVFAPIHHESRLFGYAVVVAHHNDVGGRVAGSSAADSREVFQEGLRLPPVLLYAGHELNRPILDVIRLNVRAPDVVQGDLEAQLAACRIAQRGIGELIERYGAEPLEQAFEDLLDYSESAARSAIAALPDGTYAFEDQLDDDGITPGVPVPIRVALTVSGDSLTADFAGSSPQVEGAINATFSFTKSAVYFAMRSITPADAPNNAGFFRPIRVVAPEGSILNPRPPGACAARGVTGFRVIDTIFGALSKVVPDRVRAAGEGGTTSYSLASYAADGTLTLFREAVMGAWGAGAAWDGVDGVANPAANISNAPVELVEHQAPVRIERYALAEDSGGAGLHRGGLAVERCFTVLAERASLQLRSDRSATPPYGLFGGLPGRASRTELRTGEDWTPLPAKFVRQLAAGQSVRHVTAGGGGYGDPMKRPPERVLADVIAGKVSRRQAEEVYGVRFDTALTEVDPAATAAARGQGE